ncbi:MAG: alpha/beta hydrolase [Pseudonocardiaceae bacterium]
MSKISGLERGFVVNYDFDPELAPWAPHLAPVDYSDVEVARATLREIMSRQPIYAPVKPMDVTHRRIPGVSGPPVTLRIYRPSWPAEPTPALIYPHWGGFVTGDLDTSHSSALQIADKVGAVVVSVDYRLAPEHPFPAALDDCDAALQWVLCHAGELGIDPDRLGVGGASAGGGLAAALVLRSRDRNGPRLCFQHLVFPELDDRLETVSARSFVDTPMLDRANALLSWRHYLGPATERGSAGVSYYAAPARAEDLSGLPPTFVSVCEFDPLRDEGIAYARRLAQAGVPTQLCQYPGTFHASIAIADASISRKMVADQIDALRQGLR